jgi:hypothetical protein
MPGQIPAAQLATLTYRSKASSAFPRDGLDSILDVARSRNHALSVTGLLIYDNGRIFQWLEGPPENVANIWSSIRQDKRHTDIEVLEYATSADRVFGEWDMKLATKPPQSPLLAHGYVPLTMAMMAPTLLVEIGCSKVPGPRYPALWSSARHRMLPLAHPRAEELARLLLDADPAQAFALLDLLTADADSIGEACASVSEPAARSLGELWAADDCSEVDVLLGLGRLRSAIRRCDVGSKDQAGIGPLMKTVLVVPQPGERHMIGAALDAEVLCRDGFEPTCEFPVTNEALNQIAGKQWFDAIDVSLSSAFMREESLPRMAQTIAGVRKASLNPNVVVVVGGRIFFEHGAVASTVGADDAHMSALQVPQSIRSVSRP